MVPKEDEIGPQHIEESLCEMWNGRTFLDRETFKKILSKFALYNNFVSNTVKSNKREVTTRCGDESCR